MKTVEQGFLVFKEHRQPFLGQDHLEQFLVSKDKMIPWVEIPGMGKTISIEQKNLTVQHNEVMIRPHNKLTKCPGGELLPFQFQTFIIM